MKNKVKDQSRKAVVDEYQKQGRQAIDDIIKNNDKLKPSTKIYIDILEENIKRAPYLLGYLFWPEENKSKSKL